MASNINQNGNFHTPLSPMRFQASMGKEVRRRYKDGKNMVRLMLARVTKVNYKYNTVEVAIIKTGDTTTHNSNDNGKFSARLPIQFGGNTPDGKVYGTNTLVTVGSLVLVGFLDGNKNNPIVLNIYGTTDNQSLLTRTSFTGADESDEDLQQELWQLFSLYPSMTYKNIDGHGNQEITFPGKTFFYSTADNQQLNDVYFDYDNLPSSTYANGDSIEPISPDAPNMLYVHQAIYDKHRLTFFIKQDGTLRIGSRHIDGGGVTFLQMNTDGSFKIQQTNDGIDPEIESNKFSSFSIEEDGTIILAAGEHTLMIGENGILFDGSAALSGDTLDLSNNQTIKDITGSITTLQEATTADGIMSVVTSSTGWESLNDVVHNKTMTFTSQPVPPYNVGDIWEKAGQIYVCTNPQPTGSTFSSSDWTLGGDVTSQNTSNDTSNVGGTSTTTVLASISSANNTASAAQTTANNASSTASSAQSTATAAQNTANMKSRTFTATPVPPYSIGDLWQKDNGYYTAIEPKSAGQQFDALDWIKSADITADNTANDTANVNGTASGTVISNITGAQNIASAAQTTANSKAKTFMSQPVPPYNVGDVYNTSSGQIYVCMTARSTGSYTASDWVLASDITANNTANDTANVNGTSSSTVITNITTAQNTANAKAKTFNTQPVPPYNEGDIWQSTNAVYICTVSRSSGSYTSSDWYLAGDVTGQNTSADSNALGGTSSSTINTNITNASNSASAAQTTANSKAKTFTAQPAPPYNAGDLWKNGAAVYVSTVTRASGSYVATDWVLSGDVTSSNTANDTANVNGTTASTVTTNITNAQNTANSANTLATSKAKGFISQPIPPYNTGDVWNNSGSVYVCTTAKASGTSFALSDWTLGGDVTANNTSANSNALGGTSSSTITGNITSAQNTANAKAQGFVTQPIPPYNKGDVWSDNGTVYSCTTSRASGSFQQTDWTLMGDVTSNNTSADTNAVGGTSSSTVLSNISGAQNTASSASSAASSAQSTANSAQTLASSKASTFLSQPTPPYNKGDIWIDNGQTYVANITRPSTATFLAADWNLAADITSQNTSADTSAVNGTSSSTVITNITAAQNTADSKAYSFLTTPEPPYNVGDLWNNNGQIYICNTSKLNTGTYSATDWTLQADVTGSNTAADTKNVNGTSSSTITTNITNAQNTANSANTAASNAQSTANTAQTTATSKAKGFITQPVPPYNTGDIWNNNGTVYICTTARSTGSYTATDWKLSGDVTANNTSADTSKVNGTTSSTVITNITTAQNTANSANTAASNAQTSANTAQTTANSKAQGFIAQPVPPYNTGDVWNDNGTVYICTTAKASGGTFAQSDWTLSGDVTANNTSADTAAVNGTTSSTVITNITTAQNTATSANTAASNAQSTANSASTAASNAQSTANTANTAASNAQTTANSKAKTFTATPTVPYSVGDIFKNGQTTYICTTARSSGSYTSTDWTLSGDVTSLNTAKDTAAVNGTTSSTVITNITTAQNTANSASTSASNAQSTANTAQTTANSKAQTFTNQPVPPYNVGDMWKSGAAVYVCTTAKASGTSYASTDWILSGDVTANNTSADTSAVNGTTSSTVITNITTAQNTANSANTAASNAQSTANTANTAASNAQTTANSKAKTFTATPTIPYNVGDIYKNGQATYICTTARSSGSYTSTDWILSGDVTSLNTSADTSKVNGTTSSTVITNITTAQNTANSANTAASNAQSTANTASTAASNAQTTANSKAQTFTNQPAPPYNVGDVWKNGAAVYVCTTAKASGTSYASTDWVLSGDVTSSNTANDTSNVNGTTSSTVISNITSASNSASAANTAASNAQSTANSASTAASNAQTTANSKAKTFTSTPVPPYSIGDLYKNGSTVYICTTAKASGGTYASTDFVLAGDVTANNTANDTSHVNGTTSSTVTTNITNAQNTANSKAKTFTSTPVPPYSLGDLYKNGTTVYMCTTARASGSYVSTDFTLVGDVTSQNTSADTSKVSGTASSTVITNITNAQNTASAAQTSVNNLQVGGTNLLTGTEDMSGNVHPSNNTTTTYNGLTIAQSVGPSTSYVDTFQQVSPTLEPGQYTVSFYAMASANCNIDNFFYSANNTTNAVSSTGQTSTSVDGNCNVSITTTWQRYWITWTTTSSGVTQNVLIGRNPNSGVTVSIAGVKLEKGNKATDWSPAPQDQSDLVNNLVIGGRNYLLNTSNMNDLTNWQLSVGADIVATLNAVDDATYPGVLNLDVTTNSTVSGSDYIVVANTGITLPNGKFTVGNTYTLSFLMKNDFPMYVMFADINGANPVATRSADIPANSSWERMVYTFTATATGNSPVLYFSTTDQTDTGNVYITEVQLEDGPKASGYRPAQEDTDAAIQTNADNVFNITQGVFPDAMGQAIVSQVTNSTDYSSTIAGLVPVTDYNTNNTNVANSISQAQSSAQNYTDNAIKGIDFSPYVQNERLTQTQTAITAQFSQSGGVNLLVNSVGYSSTDFWNVALDSGGQVATSQDSALAQYGSNSGFALTGGSISQTVSVTPNVPYTLGVIINKGSAGDAYMQVDDGQGTVNKMDFPDGTAYSWPSPTTVSVTNADGSTTDTTIITPMSINITPTSSELTVTLYGAAATGGVVFTCVMLNIGNQPFNWQMHMGEAYNTNVTFNQNGITVSHTDDNGIPTGVTIMTYEKFAGYRDVNNDGQIDVSDGSADEVFRVDQDTFVMKSSTIGPIKTIQVTSGGYNGIAFVKSS